MRVEDAHGQPPSIPFWLGEAPARSNELSAAVAELRGEVEKRLEDREEAQRWVEGLLTGCHPERSEGSARTPADPSVVEPALSEVEGLPQDDTSGRTDHSVLIPEAS